jgi:hypothetical protein
VESTALGRLLGALVAPAKTFRAIAERPTWLLPFLVVCLTPVLPGLLAGPKIDWEGVVRSQLERADVDVPREQMEQAVGMWEKLGPILTYVGPLMIAVSILLFTVVFWGAFTLAGGQPGFKRSLAVVSHAMLPVAVAALLSIPVVLSMDTIGAQQLESGSYLQSSLAAFAPEDAGPVLLALLSKIDVFTIWTVVLLAIGFRYAAGVPQRTAALTAGLLWVVWICVNVGLAALGRLAAGGGGS